MIKWSSHKYYAQRQEVDGINFDSKKEARRYQALKQLQKVNEVKYFIRQPSFDIGAGVKYKADFLIVWTNGKVTIEDVKGYQTPTFKMKKKLVEAKYPIKIELI